MSPQEKEKLLKLLEEKKAQLDARADEDYQVEGLRVVAKELSSEIRELITLVHGEDLEPFKEAFKLSSSKHAEDNDPALHVLYSQIAEIVFKPKTMKEMVDLLFSNMARGDINERINDMLHEAINNPQALQAILKLVPENERLAAITKEDDFGESVLYVAVANPQLLQTILPLLPQTRSLTEPELTAVQNLIKQITELKKYEGEISINHFVNKLLALIIEEGYANKLEAKNAFEAVFKEHLEIVNTAGLQPTLKKITAAFDSYANAADNTKKLQLLMNQLATGKCDLEAFKSTAMLLAKNRADLKIKDSVIFSGNTLLHHLVLTNKANVNDKEIEELLERDRSLINVKDKNGRTPLQSLLRSDPKISVASVAKLIQLGSDLRSTDNNGETLLHAACASGNFAVAQYLAADKGLDIRAKTSLQRTMLHCCATGVANQKLWQWLCENNVNINAQDDSKSTALHLAVENGNRIMVQWLAPKNASLAMCNKEGNTALGIATKNRSKDIIDDLLKVGAGTSEKLLAAIQKMHEYGEQLHNQGSSEGQVAISLADQLQLKAEEFFNKKSSPANFEVFKNEFSTLLTSKNKEMSEYRASWGTIVANVAIALTGIGALVIAGKLIYSKATEGRALFFNQKMKTTREEKIEEVANALASIGKPGNPK